MLMIRPKTVNDAALTSSSAAETSAAPWDAAATYGINDQVGVLPTAVVTNQINTTVASLGGGVYRITKTGGVNGATDDQAYGSPALPGDFVIRINKPSTSGECVVGVDTSNSADPNSTAPSRAVDLFAGGNLYALNSGSYGGTVISTYTGSDYIFIRRVGAAITILKGPSTNIAAASAIGSLTDLSGPVYFRWIGYTSSVSVDVLVSYVSSSAPAPLYRSLQASNTNHDPASSPTWWVANGSVYPTWSSSTLYALNDIITDTTGHRLYQSLSGGTSATVTMTIASPAVVTWTAHGLAANAPITFITTGALPTGLSVGTTYYVLAPTTNTFNVSATAGGAAINTSGSQSGVHTAVANPNLNKAITTASFWLDIGPSNKWAMFDSYNGTATTDAELIDVTMNLTGRADSLALLSLASAVSVRVIASTVADGTLYDMTYQLTSTDGISNWCSWFFEDIVRKSNLLLTDLPTNLNPTVRVILTGTGTSTMECGNLVIGQQKDLGRTLHDGTQIGIIDYSRKDVDAFGNYTIIQRAFSKRGSFRMRITKAQVDGIHETLSAFRATPAVYSATADYGSALIFGFFRSFDIAIDYPLESLVSIEIEGLT